MRLAAIGICGSLAATPLAAQQAASSATESRALAPIVGVWQSDVVDGHAARSNCAWSPDGAAVICEQAITSPQGIQHALNFFTRDPRGGRFVFYVLNDPGDTIRPVPLSIDGAVWTYGGGVPGPDGKTWRTINDFSKPGAYTWKAQMSADGRDMEDDGRRSFGARGRFEAVARRQGRVRPSVDSLTQAPVTCNFRRANCIQCTSALRCL